MEKGIRLAPLHGIVMAMEQQRGRMPRERDDDSGQFVESYPPEAFIEAIRERDGMASTPELTDALGCSNRRALDRLRDLEDEGMVESRKVGNAYLWMVEDG